MEEGDLILAAIVALSTLVGAGVGGAITAFVTMRAEDNRAKREDARHDAAAKRDSRLAARLISSDIATVLASVNQALHEQQVRHAHLKVDLVTTWREHRAGLADLTTEEFDLVDAAVAYVTEFPWRSYDTTEAWSSSLATNLSGLSMDLHTTFDMLRTHVN